MVAREHKRGPWTPASTNPGLDAGKHKPAHLVDDAGEHEPGPWWHTPASRGPADPHRDAGATQREPLNHAKPT